MTRPEGTVMKHIPLPWIIVAIVAFCLVGLGSYFGFWQITKPTITLPQPPSQHEVIPPATPKTPTPEPESTSLPKVEVEWETNGPFDARYIAVITFDDNKGEIIYAIGSKGEIRPVSVWKSNNGGDSWEYVGKITDPGINFQEKEKIYEEFVLSSPTSGLSYGSTVDGKIISFAFAGENPTGEKRDPNNKNIILKPNLVGVGKVTSVINPNLTTSIEIWEFLLSFDNGKTFSRIDLPPPYQNGVNLFIGEYTLISSNGTLKIFYSKTEIWKTEIILPH